MTEPPNCRNFWTERRRNSAGYVLKAVIGKLSEGHWAALPMHAGLSREERFRGRQRATQISGHDTALLGLRAELNVALPLSREPSLLPITVIT